MSTSILIPPRGPALRPPRGPVRRRIWASRVARVLLPPCAAQGGFVSTEVEVVGPGGSRWPDVALACREPPPDGRLERPPELVILPGLGAEAAAAAADWLRAGAVAVWCVGPDRVVEHRAGRPPATRRPAEALQVPGLDATVPVAQLLT